MMSSHTTTSSSFSAGLTDSVRIVVVGDCGSGKSCFIASLAGGTGVNLNSSGAAGLSTDHAAFYTKDGSRVVSRTSARGCAGDASRRVTTTQAEQTKSSGTVGCALSCLVVERSGGITSSSSSVQGKPLLVELLEVGAHERFTKLRRLFYKSAPVDGVIVVFDLSARRSARSVARWISELSETANFSTSSGVPGAGNGQHRHPQLPVPLLVVGNKEDLSDEKIRRRARNASGVSVGNAFWGWLYAILVRITAPAWVLRIFLFGGGGRKRKAGDGGAGGGGGGYMDSLIPSQLDSNQYRGPMTKACSTKGRVDRLEIDAFFEQCISTKQGGGGGGAVVDQLHHHHLHPTFM